MTVSDLLTAALQRIGVIAAGETPPAEDTQLALDRLNGLIDSWRTDRLFDFSLVRTTWTITSNDAIYTLGSGGDINIQRPAHVLRIRYIDTSADPDLELTLGEPLTELEYQGIPQKALTSPYPQRVFYNATFPLATVTFWPVPTSSTLQGVIYTPNANAELALSDTLEVPPGYWLFYQDTLAVHMAPDFEVTPSGVLVQSQAQAESRVKRSNHKVVDLAVDYPFGPSQYDINNDQ